MAKCMDFLAIIWLETIKVGPFYGEKFSQGRKLNFDTKKIVFVACIESMIWKHYHSKKSLGRRWDYGEVSNGKLRFTSFRPIFGPIWTNLTYFRPTFDTIWTNVGPKKVGLNQVNRIYPLQTSPFSIGAPRIQKFCWV